MQIGIIANMDKPLAAATLAALRTAARPLDIHFVLPADSPAADQLPGARIVAPSRFGAGLDAVLSLGGDGTVLRAVRSLHGGQTPVLGINLGHLGFLTAVSSTSATDALAALAAGRYVLAEAPLLEARLFRADAPRRTAARQVALNDVVIGWGAAPRSAMIDLAVDGQPVASYVSDGFIVATPLGSTGHALSAGGPILHPSTSALVLAPICPHTLSSRPLVLPASSCIELTLPVPAKELLLSVDGVAGEWLHPGDRLVVRRSPRSARFIHLADYSWPRLLTQKLHWRGSSADPK